MSLADLSGPQTAHSIGVPSLALRVAVKSISDRLLFLVERYLRKLSMKKEEIHTEYDDSAFDEDAEIETFFND